MKQLEQLARSEYILTEKQMGQLLEPVDDLPEATEALVGKTRFIRRRQSDDTVLAFTYKCVMQDGTPTWKPINDSSAAELAPVTGLWATHRIDTSYVASVMIHWTDPEDDADAGAYWAYDVIVRKRGSVPTSIHDGVVVGYSSVRNQYKRGSGFVDSLDISTIEASEQASVSQDTHAEDAVYYNVFAVTKYGVATGTQNGCLPVLGWYEAQRLIQEGFANDIFKLGDLVEIKHDTFGKLDVQVVDIDDAGRYRDEHGNTVQHSVTFMTDRVLFRGSFDSRQFTNPPQDMRANGRNQWSLSNIREWLNTDKAANTWHDSSKGDYSYNFNNAGTYGAGPGTSNQFDGFLRGLPSDLADVLKKVKVRTTVPFWNRDNLPDLVLETDDKVFLPSYEELFGNSDSPHATKPSDVVFGEGGEGSQFGIYRDNKTDSRMKLMLPKYDTTRDTDIDSNNLASWYTRTASRNADGYDIVYMVTNVNRNYDEVNRDLGEDGAAVIDPYESADQRDSRDNEFTGGYKNNTAPGFAPCFVVA